MWWGAVLLPLLASPPASAQAGSTDVDAHLLALVPVVSTRTGNTPPTSTLGLTTCTTPEGQQGVCGLVSSCPQYVPLAQNLQEPSAVQFFLDRVCRTLPNAVHICCPQDDSQRQPQSDATRPSPDATRPQLGNPRPQPGNRQPSPGATRPSLQFGPQSTPGSSSPQRPNSRKPVVSTVPQLPQGVPVRGQIPRNPTPAGGGNRQPQPPQLQPPRPQPPQLQPPQVQQPQPQLPQLQPPQLQPQPPQLQPQPPQPQPQPPQLQPQPPQLQPSPQRPLLPPTQRPLFPPPQPQQPQLPFQRPSPSQRPTLPPPQRPTQRPTRPTQRPTLPPTQRPTLRPTQRPPLPPPQQPPPSPTQIKIPTDVECGQLPVGFQEGDVWPWVVRVGDEGRCGGTLITDAHVLAPAHCLDNPDLTEVVVGGRTILALGLVYPGYDPFTHLNDLALLTLATPLVLSGDVQPACLPFRYNFDGFRYQTLTKVAPPGDNEDDSDDDHHSADHNAPGQGRQNRVEVDQVEVVGLQECRPPLPTSTFPSSVQVEERRHLCGASIFSTSPCEAAGSSLMYHDEHDTGRYYLVGLGSLAPSCIPQQPSPALPHRSSQAALNGQRSSLFIPGISQPSQTISGAPQQPSPVPSSPVKSSAALYTRVGAFLDWITREIAGGEGT